jgi:hypothetical protein
MDDFLYAEVGFACAGSADDETQFLSLLSDSFLPL